MKYTKYRPEAYFTSKGPARTGRPERGGLFHVGTSRDGCRVYDRPNSHNHLPPDLLHDAIARTNLSGAGFAKHVIAFDTAVCTTDCVPVGETDEVLFAQRPGRRGLTKFVKRRSPVPTPTISVVVKPGNTRDEYILITAFPGESEPEPWDANATEAARQFWKTHALIWGSCPIVPGTETRMEGGEI